jgi:chemotaxis protein MotB
LSGRDQALARVNRQLAELSDMLALERSTNGELRLSIAQLNRDAQSAGTTREKLAAQLANLRQAAEQSEAERDTLHRERDRLAAELADAQLQAQSNTARTEQLQTTLADEAARVDSSGQVAASAAAQVADARRALAAERTRRETTEAALSDAHKLADTTRAQITLLSQQLDQLRTQLAQVAAALDASEQAGRDKDLKIANLGQRLNTALAARVEELQRYRSEFFGRLRSVLADRPGIQIVGDRFVFQSEVLFPLGSAELTATGIDQLNTLAATLRQIAGEIPPDLPWMLRVDGHADKQKIANGPFASNWELSAQRAINVTKLLIAQGVPATHLASTAFGDNQPLAVGSTPDDYAKNRRIELRLTDR